MKFYIHFHIDGTWDGTLESHAMLNNGVERRLGLEEEINV